MPQLDNSAVSFSLGVLLGLVVSGLGLGLISSKIFFSKEMPYFLK